jgi:hypothetical protein
MTADTRFSDLQNELSELGGEMLAEILGDDTTYQKLRANAVC